MNIKNFLYETFIDMMKDGENAYSIYSFPLSNSEKKDLLNSSRQTLRFIADPERKKVYIFSSELLHYNVDKKIGIHKYVMSDKPCIFGVVNRDFKIEDSSSLKSILYRRSSKKAQQYLDIDWSFMTKYLKGFDYYIKKLKEVIKEYPDED